MACACNFEGYLGGYAPVTVTAYLDTVPFSSLGKEIEIQRIIAVFEKRPLTPVTTLCHVVRNTRQNHARKASH